MPTTLSHRSQLLVETDTVHGIPVLTIAPDGAERCPAIFFISGFGGGKEDGLRLGYQLARVGFFFMGFDPWLHGERYEPWRDQAADPAFGGVYPPDTGLDTGVLFFRIIQQCLLDVQILMDHYADDPRVDVHRSGVTGPSMGGYASFLVFAHIPAVQAAVPMVGIPQFTRRWQDIVDECAFSNPAWAAALRKLESHVREHTALIAQIDPAERLKHAAPRALLIMNGDFDTDQPKLYAIACYRELQAHNTANPERLRLRIYPAGHIVTPEMEQDTVAWFQEHLLGRR
ncbi:MAG TPA: prolyl oligopeptidase family serine peptidase [Roseiflexaceae bacterium]|nr:prolyl oligopeptidase family serine peptidase [Roseiflexaceae bacterium]